VSVIRRASVATAERRYISYQDMFGRGTDLSNNLAPTYAVGEAMKLSAVAACVELRANYLAQMPWDSYRDGPNGTSLKVSPPPIAIRRPSARGIPRSVWMKQAQYARMLWGNATLVIGSRDGAGYPTSLDVLPPWEVHFSNTSILERLEVRVCGQLFNRDDLIIVPGGIWPGRTVGIAPLAASGLTDLGNKAQDFGRNWFTNGAVPSSIIYSDTVLDGPQAEALSSSILSKWKNRKPAVLGSGLKYEKISVPANESQFLETIRQNSAEIAIVLGVPPEEIGVAMSGQSVTYANREQRVQQLLINTVNSDIQLWQEVFYDVVPQPQYIRFNTAALLRSDLMTRYTSYEIAMRSGFLLEDEVRALEDLGPMPPRKGGFIDAKGLADAIQRIATGVDIVLTADEAREILNRDGAALPLKTPALTGTPAAVTPVGGPNA
jgi:HK97 family phage portal protein